MNPRLRGHTTDQCSACGFSEISCSGPSPPWLLSKPSVTEHPEENMRFAQYAVKIDRFLQARKPHRHATVHKELTEAIMDAFHSKDFSLTEWIREIVISYRHVCNPTTRLILLNAMSWTALLHQKRLDVVLPTGLLLEDSLTFPRLYLLLGHASDWKECSTSKPRQWLEEAITDRSFTNIQEESAFVLAMLWNHVQDDDSATDSSTTEEEGTPVKGETKHTRKDKPKKICTEKDFILYFLANSESFHLNRIQLQELFVRMQAAQLSYCENIK
jgi:hypothetical protein